MIKHFIKKIFNFFYDKSLPAVSWKEKQALMELKETFSKLGCIKKDSFVATEKTWLENREELGRLVLSKDPRCFLRWDVILNAMFVGNVKYVSRELGCLKKNKSWNGRWRPAIRESHVGHPMLYLLYPQSSGNLIHSAFHG